MNTSRYVAEFIGTLVFLTVILKSGGDKYVVVAGLLAAILLMGNVSGGHFNPAVTVMELSRGQMDNREAAGYIGAQLVGALAAVRLAALQ
jgi:aquaporin Z